MKIHDDIKKGIEAYETSKNMDKFFENLSNLKSKIAREYNRTGNKFLGEIYKDFHATFKNTEEKQDEDNL